MSALEKPSEANSTHEELMEATALMARNAALGTNALHMEAELRRREGELVEARENAEHDRNAYYYLERECEALRAANTNLLQELQRRDKARDEEVERLSTGVGTTADKWLDRYVVKAEELEADNTRLRRALLEQATCFAATLKALQPA